MEHIVITCGQSGRHSDRFPQSVCQSCLHDQYWTRKKKEKKSKFWSFERNRHLFPNAKKIFWSVKAAPHLICTYRLWKLSLPPLPHHHPPTSLYVVYRTVDAVLLLLLVTAVLCVLQPEIEMNWNLMRFLPEAGACQTNFSVSMLHADRVYVNP